MKQNYDFIEARVPIKAWTKYVPFDDNSKAQIKALASMPFVQGLAIMPDVHLGIGSSIGTVAALSGAIVPAIVGVDIGCGMMAVKTTIMAKDLPDNLHLMRCAIENAVPHGRTDNGGRL